MNTYRADLSKVYQTLKQGQARSQQQTNAGLWFDKYIENQEGKDSEDTQSRRNLVDQVSALPIPEAYNMFYEERWKKMLGDYGAKFQEAEAKGRIAIGLGDESVLETSVTLHRTYGVPYIPGSALKGLTANYARQRLGDAWKNGSEAYKVVFGDTNNAGYIIFFDALYIPGTGHKHNGKIQMLYPDVITVHHQKYYQGTENALPADWDSPNPVPFLSATGKYLIALAAPELLQESDKWIKNTFEILENALKDMGIGAKTSSGYGRMEFEQKVDLSSPDIQAALRLKEEIDQMPDTDVSRRMQAYFPKWRDMASDEARMIVTKAIIEKVDNAGVERTIAGQTWYKVLLTWLAGR
jgi:CRISPR-associated protein Cmr6